MQKKRKGRERLAGEADFTFLKVIVLSLDNSDDKKGSSKENKENTNKDITDKDITDEDCIHESNYAMSKGKYVPVSKKHNPKFKSSVLVKGCMLGLSNVTTCDEIVNKMGARKSKICEDKAKGKRKMLALFRNQAFASKHLQAFAAFTASKHLQLAFAGKHLQLAFAGKHFQLAFADKHLQLAAYKQKFAELAFTFCICSLHLKANICILHLQASICKQSFSS
ncbi:hypothetical protein Tco_0027753 [Tanacetum coccineum]